MSDAVDILATKANRLQRENDQLRADLQAAADAAHARAQERIALQATIDDLRRQLEARA